MSSHFQAQVLAIILLTGILLLTPCHSSPKIRGLSPDTALIKPWLQTHGDYHFSNLVNFNISHSDWSTTIDGDIDTNSMVFASHTNNKECYLYMIVNQQNQNSSRFIKMNTLNGMIIQSNEVIIPQNTKTYFEPISTLIDSLGNYYTVRNTGVSSKGSVLLKISTQTLTIQTLVFKEMTIIIGMVISERNNLLIIHATDYILALDLDTLKEVWTSQLKENTQSGIALARNIVLVENEFQDGLDIVYCSYASFVYRIRARDGNVMTSLDLDNNGQPSLFYSISISYTGLPGYLVLVIKHGGVTDIMSIDMITKTTSTRTIIQSVDMDCSLPMTKYIINSQNEHLFETVFSCSNITRYLHWTFGSNYLLGFSTKIVASPQLEFAYDLGIDSHTSNLPPLVSLDSSHRSILVESPSSSQDAFKYDLVSHSFSKIQLTNTQNNDGMSTKSQTFSALNSRLYICKQRRGEVNCYSTLIQQ